MDCKPLKFEIEIPSSYLVNNMKEIFDKYNGDICLYLNKNFTVKSNLPKLNFLTASADTKKIIRDYENKHFKKISSLLEKEQEILKKIDDIMFLDDLESLRNYHGNDNLIELLLNKEDLKKVSEYVFESSFNEGITNVFIDNVYMVGTDTKILYAIKHNLTEIKEDFRIQVPSCFCEAYILNHETKLFYVEGYSFVYLFMNNKIYKYDFSNKNYPNYKKIIPDTFYKMLDTLDFVGNSKSVRVKQGRINELSELEENTTRAFIYNNEDITLCSVLDRVDFGLPLVGLNKGHSSFMLFDKDKDRLQIVLPFLFEESVLREYIKQ